MKPIQYVLLTALAAAVLLGGCATKRAPGYDYSRFQAAKPATLLVMPPVSDATDVKASPGVWAQTTRPLAEAGYYVLPITLVDETFRENGVNSANDAQDIPVQKLRDYFGADAAVYIRVKTYGTTYKVISSETTVVVEARIIDLRDGALLWQGFGSASSAEQGQQQQSSIVGLLVSVIVKQIAATVTDASFNYAAIADARLLGAPRYNGVLPGPHSPFYGRPPMGQ